MIPYRLMLWAIGGVGLGVAGLVHAQTGATATPARRSETASSTQVSSSRPLSAVDARWIESLNAFAEADRAHAPSPGGVLFVGSSSIRLWTDLETQFDITPGVIKRGFGGSRLSDCAKYVDRLVLPYQPRLIVVYAGDNDLAEGAQPAEVLASFQQLVRAVRQDLPKTRIAYVSIKPSPLRLALLPQIQEANRLIEAFASGGPGLDFIDVHTKMLDENGMPRADLYQADQLHLNSAGYALWRREIAAHLDWTPPADGLKPKLPAASTATTAAATP